MSSANTISADVNLAKVGGVNETGADWTTYLVNLLNAYDSAAAEFGVIPKAKGKTTIRQRAVASGATSALYTVTAGKTLYLCSLVINGAVLAAAGAGYAYIQCDVGGNGVFTIIAIVYLGTAGGAVTFPSETATATPCVPMPFTAGTVFQVVSSNANINANGTIMGWEE